MTTSLQAHTERAFAELLASLDVELGIAEGELQIVADDWTLVLEGDAVASALFAVDDEDAAPDAVLDEVLDAGHLAAMQALNMALAGRLSAALCESPDPLANALAARIG